MTRLSPSHYVAPEDQASSPPEFFYANAVYDNAYRTVSSALRTRKGLILLIGEAGTGKSKLMRLMSRTLEEQIRIYPCSPSPTTFTEVLATFDDLLPLAQRAGTPLHKLEVIIDRLHMWTYRGGTSVLVIDDAHALDLTVLEQLSLLLHVNSTGGSPLQVVLIGRPELDAKLATPELRHLQKQVAVRAYLTPLQADEVRAFIHERYRSPRGLRQYLFTAEAIERIAHHSRAIPARIATLCESSLMVAYVQGQKIVTPEVVERQAQKLFAPPALFPSVPITVPPLPDEAEQLTNSALHNSHLHFIRHYIVRSARALVTVGVCAMLLWASMLVAKQIKFEQFTAALVPIVQKGTQALAVFFPQSLFAQPAVNEPNREPQGTAKKQQKTR
jgi:general secretion pathway protein A